MRQNLFDSHLFSPLIEKALKMRTNTEELSAAKTMDANEPPVHFLSEAAGGLTTTRNIALPDPTENDGLMLIVFNLGGPTTPPGMEFQETTTTSARTVVTVESGEGALLVSNGATWKGLVGATS